MGVKLKLKGTDFSNNNVGQVDIPVSKDLLFLYEFENTKNEPLLNKATGLVQGETHGNVTYGENYVSISGFVQDNYIDTKIPDVSEKGVTYILIANKTQGSRDVISNYSFGINGMTVWNDGFALATQKDGSGNVLTDPTLSNYTNEFAFQAVTLTESMSLKKYVGKDDSVFMYSSKQGTGTRSKGLRDYRLGGNADMTTNSNPLKLSMAGVYNNVLSETEIQKIYNYFIKRYENKGIVI